MADKKKEPAGRKAGGRVVAFIAMFLLLCALALVRQGSLFGYAPQPAAETQQPDVITTDGSTTIVCTTTLAEDVQGYGGPVPVRIYITGGHIDSISALSNAETPSFFSRLAKQGLTHAWDGLTPAEAATKQVDAVSGATYSSKAYIANVQRGLAYVLDNPAAAASAASADISIALVAAILVILAGAILPLFIHSHRYRIVQQLLNAGVLGFWTGTFLDYAMMLRFFGEGLVFTLAIVPTLLLLIVGLLYPLFGKGTHYCNWLCPYGSLQDLASAACPKKIKLPQSLVKTLDTLRRVLWIVLIALLFLGWGASWIDYEVFTAFIVRSAAWSVLSVGILFIVLSLFIPRPFCRFVCPTGSLLKTPFLNKC